MSQPYPSDLSNAQWAFIEPLIPSQKAGRGRPHTVDYRRILEAILYVERTGCQWDYLPHDFPPSDTVYYYFERWRDAGVFQAINDALNKELRQQMGKESTPSLGIIDSKSVKTTVQGGPMGFDGGKKSKAGNGISLLIRMDSYWKRKFIQQTSQIIREPNSCWSAYPKASTPI